MEKILEIKNLSKSFGKRKVIKNISFDVYAGEVFGFLGPNGSGKTTTIKMIMGFLFPDSGQIIINGIDVEKNYEKALSFVGGIVENPEMYLNISGKKNLEMYAKLHDNVSNSRIDEVVKLVGMENRLNEKVKKYSLGMKQRIGLAQALVHRPRLLILDEPTNGLDPAGIKELRDILKKLAHEENVAVMVSSHLLSEMQLMCDRVGIISNGEIIDQKPISELVSNITGKPVYRFMTKFAKEAAGIIAEGFEEKIKEVTDDFIALEIEENEVPAVISQLSNAKIPIFGVNKIERSLEDAFIDITGGGKPIV